MRNPYETFPPRAFWRSAVADKGVFGLADVWSPKFEMGPTTQIATAGSCFAQHLSRRLVERGFSWVNAERPPAALTPQQRARFNYDIFSFRTGAIYTTPLLEQWLDWALAGAPPSAEVWKEEGRFFDPLRPAIEPDGFGSLQELHNSRATTLRAIKAGLSRADCFVFTLGLTEAWLNATGSLIYANCPGVIRGTFDPKQHVFHQFTFNETYRALISSIAKIRKINPDIKVLLTVSPVPLTATGSNEHVLVANSHSKAVLRSVAAEISAADAHIDYFPSFELLTSFTQGGVFFEPNMRTVTRQGVDFVMEPLFAAMEVAKTRSQTRGAERSAPDDDDEYGLACEDRLLEHYNEAPVSSGR